jgi:tripartite-type tricarboxylate transporter receptor subunit TctC
MKFMKTKKVGPNRREATAMMARWAAVGAVLENGTGAFAQGTSYPTRAVKIINPFPPGSPVDVVARLVAQKLQEAWGQIVVVDYKGGAGGTLGAEFVARAPPDGYTLLVTSSSTHVIAPALRKQMPYDALKDFVPIALVAYGPTALVVHPSLPVRTLAEFVHYAKANPGKVAYASSGTGTILHLSGELFQSRTGSELLHVPYKGAVPASNDLLGGQVQAMFDSISNSAPQVKAGKLRALAVMTAQRSLLMPDVPTTTEAGFAGLDFPAWLGLFAPAGVPREVVIRSVNVLQLALAQPETKERLIQSGLIPALTLEGDFMKLIVADQKTVSELVKQAAIPLQ